MSRLLTACIPAAVLCSVLSGCASKGDLELLQRDTEEMKSRVMSMTKEMASIRTDTKEQAEAAKKGLLQELDGFKAEFAQLRKTTADLQANQDAGKGEIQSLAGRIDDLAITAKKPADDIALVREDLDRRYASLDERLTALDKSIRELQTKGPAPAKESPMTAETLYKQALDAQRSGDHAKGRELFTQFMQQHPKHDLAANAQYWIGETYYSEKNLEQAILAFQDVIKNYPGKEKIPAAMLKQGMAFADLGDAKSARFVYVKLKEDFPKSEEAKQAAEKLKALK